MTDGENVALWADLAGRLMIQESPELLRLLTALLLVVGIGVLMLITIAWRLYGIYLTLQVIQSQTANTGQEMAPDHRLDTFHSRGL